MVVLLLILQFVNVQEPHVYQVFPVYLNPQVQLIYESEPGNATSNKPRK